MRLRLSILALLVLLTSGLVYAQDLADSDKPAEEPLPWKARANFSAVHGEEDGGFSGFGSFQEARAILEYALRSAPTHSSQERYNHLKRAAQNARDACGDAYKYRRLIDTLLTGPKQAQSYSDAARAMNDGVEFLVSGGGGSMTKGQLNLGLSMVNGSFSSSQSAYKILKAAVQAAITEAQDEGKQQWAAILRFGTNGAKNCSSYFAAYKVLRAIALAVAEAPEGEPIFMHAMVSVAHLGLDKSEDIYKVLKAGFQEYENNVPSRTHKLVTRFVLDVAKEMSSYYAAKQVLAEAAEKMENLGYDVQPAKVIIKAGLALSRVVGSNKAQDGWKVATGAIKHTLNLDLPGHISGVLRTALQEAKSASSYYDGLKRAQSGMEYVLEQ